MNLGLGLGLTMQRPAAGGGGSPARTTLNQFSIGQSNEVGRAPIDSLGGMPAGTKMWNATSGAVVDASGLYIIDQQDDQATDMGPQVTRSAAFLANEAAGKSLVYIGAANGGTSFTAGDWRPGGAVINGAKSRLAAWKAATPAAEAVLDSIHWNQGEFDYANLSYHSDLRTFFPSLRNPAVFVGSNSTVPITATPVINGDGWPNACMIGALEELPYTATCDGHTGMVLLADGYHRNAASLRALGPREQAVFATAKAKVAATPAPSKAEWILGSDNPTYASVGGGDALALTGAAPTLGSGYLTTLAGSNRAGLITQGASGLEQDEFSFLAFVRHTAGNVNVAMVLGQWNATDGEGAYVTTAGALRWRGSTNPLTNVNAPTLVSTAFQMIVMSFTKKKASYFAILNSTAPDRFVHVHSIGVRANDRVANAVPRQFGIGCTQTASATYNGAMDFAYAAVHKGWMSPQRAMDEYNRLTTGPLAGRVTFA